MITSFAMEPFQYISALVVGLDINSVSCAPCHLRSNNLIEFSLDISVTQSTLDHFSRRSNTISATI